MQLPVPKETQTRSRATFAEIDRVSFGGRLGEQAAQAPDHLTCTSLVPPDIGDNLLELAKIRR